jgi:potassium-dependent mechanosensitive channel
VIEAVNQAIGAGLSLTVVTRGTFALVFALVVWNGLRRLKPAIAQEEACLGPYVASVRDLTGPIRVGLMMALAIVVASVLTGYVALGAFLNDQIIWIVIVAILLSTILMLIEQVFGAGLAPEARMTRGLMENIGLRQRSVEQLGVVLGGLGRLTAIIIAGLMVAAPWGVESRDLLSSLKAIFFGFKVGDVTISLSSVVLGVGLFTLGILATRAIQRWLSETFLPKTDLDAGLRNSIRTAFGYVGVIVATAVAFSSLGLSLDKLTIVAGALSLGIGFGLQSIVNNFVSGLILLWERPVRVGDWIVVGDDQGIVRRINVRSTEIMTFDRSTVIMPNSNLISGVVKNRVHSDRTGRVLLPISVPRISDPEHVASILEKAALNHREVMSEPAPKVFFKRINEASLDFELVCFVADVDVMGAVSSELHFAVFKALASGGIGAPRPHVEIEGLERIEDALEDIAEAIEDEQEERLTKAKGKAAVIKPEKPREAAKTTPASGAKRSGKNG